jgi:hypothetical protein
MATREHPRAGEVVHASFRWARGEYDGPAKIVGATHSGIVLEFPWEGRTRQITGTGGDIVDDRESTS